jgi:polar amino acid transport system substrate-binding protein
MVLPWSQSLKIARKRPNTIIYSMARTKDREEDFLWIGGYTEYAGGLYKLSGRNDITIEAVEDALKYRIGFFKDDVEQDYFISKGLDKSKIIYSKSSSGNVNNLLSGNADLIALNRNFASYSVSALGYDPTRIELVYMVDDLSVMLCFAMNKRSDKKLYNSLRSAFEKGQKEGLFDNIYRKYNM